MTTLVRFSGLLILSLLCLLRAPAARGQAPILSQLHVIGTSPIPGSVVLGGIAVDPSGNVYTSGTFFGSLRLGATTLVSTGFDDIFIAKQDPAGTYLWAVRAGGTSGEMSPQLALDGANNLYLASQTQSNACTFGALSLNTSDADVVVAKLTPTGRFLWATAGGNRRLTAPGGSTEVHGVAVTSEGEVCLTGTFTGSDRFGTTTFSSQLDTGISGSLSVDVYVARLDGAGAWRWALNAGTRSNELARGIAVDRAGNAYFTGAFGDNTGFALGTTVLYTGVDGSDIFVAKLSPAGDVLWAVKAGAPEAGSEGRGVALDAQGNIYVTGYFAGNAHFGTQTVSASAHADLFLAKLDATGTFLWATGVAGADYETGDALAVAGNDVFVGGSYFGATTMGSSTLPYAGSRDLFIAQFNTSGTFYGAVGGGGSDQENLTALASDGHTAVYAGGYSLSPSITFGTTTLPGSRFVNTSFMTRVTGTVTALGTTGGRPAAGGLVAWPNPARGGTFQIAGGAPGQPLRVYNGQGRLVRVYTSTAAGALDLTLPPGLYLLRSGPHSTRLVVE